MLPYKGLTRVGRRGGSIIIRMHRISPIFATIPEAIEEIRQGRMVIIVDDEDRENEGDLCCAAEKVTPEIINFMARWGRGLICLSLTEEKCEQLGLSLQVGGEENGSPYGTAFCVSIDAREGITTGISAQDRARTIQAAIAPGAKPWDLVRPGHIFPLRARRGGVLVRAGHTEASVDLARLAGLQPAGVICEILNEDGTMARLPDLLSLAQRHALKVITIAELIRYRLQREVLVRVVAEASLRSRYGSWRALAFESALNPREVHVALVKGEIGGSDPVLVRVHAGLSLDDIFPCECEQGGMIEAALHVIAQAGRGVFLYLTRDHELGPILLRDLRWHREGSGQSPFSTSEKGDGGPISSRDMRDYGVGAQILHLLGVRRMRLLTNHPRRLAALAGFGLEVVECLPLIRGGCATEFGDLTHQLEETT